MRSLKEFIEILDLLLLEYYITRQGSKKEVRFCPDGYEGVYSRLAIFNNDILVGVYELD